MEDRFAAGHSLTRPINARRRVAGVSLGMALAILLLGMALSACGGSGRHSSKAEPASASTTPGNEAGAAGASNGNTSGPSRASGTRSGEAGSASTVALGRNAMPPGDQDGDSPDKSAFDKDDSFVTTFGHAAGAGDRNAITSLVRRYYAAIAKDDGATACRLLFFVITESAPETYGQTAFDAAAGRGKTCGPVMSKVFKGNQAQLVAENRHLKVMAIRIEGKRAWILLRFGPQSVRRLVAYREGNAWKVGELLDTELV